MTTAIKATTAKATKSVKATKAAVNFKPTMTIKQIDAAVKDVCDRSATLQDDIQTVAVAIMLHAYAHGDYTRAQSLVDGLGKGIRAKALVDWFHKAGLNFEQDKGFTGFNPAVMVKNFDFCKENKWYTMKPENPFAGFDLDAELAKLIAKAEKAIKKDSETPADERPEDYKMNVVAEKLATLRSLAGVTLQ